MPPDTGSANGRTLTARASTTGGRQPGGDPPGNQDKDPAGLPTTAATALAGISGTAGRGGMDATAALTAITAARKLAAELEHGELAFIEAAAAAEQPGPRSPPRWAPATARPPRNATPTSRDAAPVHHWWHACRTGIPPAGDRARRPPRQRNSPRHRKPSGTSPARQACTGPETGTSSAPARSFPRSSGRRRPDGSVRPKPAETALADDHQFHHR